MEPVHEDFPPLEDPLGFLAALIERLREDFEVEVLGWEADFDGSTEVDIRLRAGQRAKPTAEDSPPV